MGKLIDLTGQKFNKLTVLQRDFNNKDKKRAYWICRCDCGNIISTRGESLRTGHTTSCGQCKNSNETKVQIKNKPTIKYKDYTNQKIGRLTVISRYNHPNDNKHTYWLCLCDCGNECIKRSDCFTSVKVPSCGCYKKESTSKQWAAQLEGKKFGKLTVIKKISHNELRSLWECQCDCGNICYLPSRYLLATHVQDCGCESRSKGELEIRTILKNKNILFKEQYSFQDCLSDKNYPLRFDFAILNDNNQVIGLIEFNGEQHYKEVEYFGGKETFILIKKRDQIKKDYCLNHNIPLLIIPYSELGHINIDNFLKNIIKE